MAHPEFVVSYAKELLKGKSNLTVEALGKKQLEELNMGALLGVGSGSTHEPKLLIIKYTADEKNKNAKIFIGKGLTFDSGGISIKPSEKMDEMKYDMCGGASVIGAMKAISELGYKTNVIGIVPLAENMPSGTAIRPGDILKSGSGKTIEVLNTDAEGRIVLADALWYAQKFFKPEYIVDLATLTGACLVALGTHFAAVLHNDEETKNKVMAAGKETGEKLWELPLTEEFKEEVKSKIADVQNMGAKGREGGTITGAAFLEAFVEKGTKWAHIDIAGMAYLSAEKSWIDKGGTGFGVATLARLAEKY
jgi:leucyl aminopeptidase